MSMAGGTGDAGAVGVGPVDIPSPIRQAFAALDSAAISWTLLRPTSSIADLQGDIDILVERRQLPAARARLEHLGFLSVPSGWPGDVVLAFHDADTGRFWWLHVQPTVRIDLEELEADDFFARSERFDGVARVSDADLLGILVLHGLLDKETIAAKYQREVAALRGAGVELPPWAVGLLTARGLDHVEIDRLLLSCEWNMLDDLVVRRTVRQPTLANRWKGRFVRFGRRWTRRGVSVAIIGPDGAGKSSLIEALAPRLPFPSTSIYMGLTGGRMPLADRLRVPGVTLLARLALIWARRIAAWSHQFRREIVIFDRYPIDGAVQPGHPITRFGRWSRLVQHRSCPPPDVAVLLDAPGDLLHRRSGEYDPETLERWRATYLELARRRDWITVVDARQPASVVVDTAVALVWDAYRARWSAHPRRRVGRRR